MIGTEDVSKGGREQEVEGGVVTTKMAFPGLHVQWVPPTRPQQAPGEAFPF